MVTPLNVAFEEKRAPPPPSNALLASNTVFTNEGDAFWIRNAPPGSVPCCAPFLKVRPSKTIVPVELSTLRTVVPRPAASTTVTPAPPTPRTVIDLFWIDTTSASGYVPGCTLIVVPLGTLLMAAWMVP